MFYPCVPIARLKSLTETILTLETIIWKPGFRANLEFCKAVFRTGEAENGIFASKEFFSLGFFLLNCFQNYLWGSNGERLLTLLQNLLLPMIYILVYFLSWWFGIQCFFGGAGCSTVCGTRGSMFILMYVLSYVGGANLLRYAEGATLLAIVTVSLKRELFIVKFETENNAQHYQRSVKLTWKISVCARLAQLVRSLTAKHEAPG